MKNKNYIYILTTILFLLDQLVKIIIINLMIEYDKIKIIPNFFTICFVKNKGAAFSILENNTFFLIIISILFIIFINKMIKKEETFTTLNATSLGMILGGVFGNLLDRIIYHSVIDYLSFKIFNYNFPIFNLADIFITVGSFLLLISMLKEKDRKG